MFVFRTLEQERVSTERLLSLHFTFSKVQTEGEAPPYEVDLLNQITNN